MAKWWEGLQDEVFLESTWERDMNVKGMEAFEKSKYTEAGNRRDAADSNAGQKATRKMLLDAADGIEEAQKSILNVRRVDRALRATVLLVPAETAALITLRVLIDRTYACDNPEDGYVFQIMCRQVSRSIETELNFRHWIKESQKAAKKYAETEGLAKIPKSQAERLIEDHGGTRRQMQRWQKTFDELNTYKWNTIAEHYCGDTLVTATVNALPQAFEKYNLTKQGKTTKMVRMLPAYRSWFDDYEMQVASRSVMKKPMLTKPKKWEMI